MGTPTGMAVGAGLQGAQAIGSGVAGKQAAKDAQRRQNSYDQTVNPIIEQAAGQLFGEGGAFTELLGGPGLAAGQGLFDRAVTGGQDFTNMMGDYQGQLLNAVGGPTAGETRGMEGAFGISDQLAGMGGPQFGFDFSNPAIGAGMNTITGATGGLSGPLAGTDIATAAAQGSMATPQAYDFGVGRTLQAQTMDAFNQAAQGARQTGVENVGQAFTQGQDALNAALASRGISPTSGVAAGATADMAMQGAGQRAMLERDLAAQAGQTALQGAQFDVGAGLQREQMESGYGLGLQGLGLQGMGQAGNLALGLGGQDLNRFATLGNLGVSQAGLGQDFALGTQGLMSNFALSSAAQQAQNLANAGNLSLGAGGMAQQGDLARAGMNSQNIVNAANLARSGYMDPLAMQQDIFSQNILNPYMAGIGGLQGMLEMGLGGLERGVDRSSSRAAQGGAGKGAGMGGAAKTLSTQSAAKAPPGAK